MASKAIDRKGFKFVKKNEQPVVVEKKSQEKSSVDTATDQPSKKRSSSSSSAAASSSSSGDHNDSKKARTSLKEESAVSKKKVDNRKDDKKAYYPDVQYTIPSKIASKASTKASHSELFSLIVTDICNEEISNLSNYFNHKKSSKGSTESILSNMIDVLNTTISDAADSCPDDIKFAPEIKASERSKRDKKKDSKQVINELIAALSKLQSFSEQLSVYERSPEQFCIDNNVLYEKPTSITARPSSGTATAQATNLPAEYSKLYLKSLMNISNKCKTIIKEATAIEGVIEDSVQIQSQLFDTYQKVRAPIASAKTKDILKAMQSF